MSTLHPQGEEILVLDGVFSDEHGDWPAGTYLLNPEGFRHAPFSRGGCLLFVKLRQFPGKDRRHVAKKTHNMPWQESHGRGVKLLYAQDSYMDSTRIEQWLPGTMSGELSYPHGAELLVLQGAFEDEHGAYDVHTWIRLPAHSRHRPTTQAGASCMSKKVDLPTCARRRSLPRELKKIKSC